MQELHRLHGVIAEALSEEQREKLAEMVHEMMGGGMHRGDEYHDAVGQMHGHGDVHEHGRLHRDDGLHEHGHLH